MARRLFAAVAITLMLVSVSAGADPLKATPARDLINAKRVLIIAHRGDSKVAPENTIPSFASAVEAGADLVELDYLHSADGIPVVIHDKTLDRTTNAKSLLRKSRVKAESLKLSELQTLDAGSWFDKKYAKTKIPKLEEALDVIQRGSMTLIERKGGDAKTCVQLIQRKELGNHVVVQSFDWKFVADCHRLSPALTLAALGDKALTEKKLDEIEKTGAKVVGWNHRNINAIEITKVHRRGLKIWVYTVNDRDRAKQLIDDGIDGIITDTPSTMLKIAED